MKGRKKSKEPPGGRRSRNSSGLVRVTTWLRTPWSGREKRGGRRVERRKGEKRREEKKEREGVETWATMQDKSDESIKLSCT